MAKAKRRAWFLGAALLAMTTGLASREYGSLLPKFLADNAGDACWTALVYCGFSFCFPTTNLITRASLTLGFAFAIETTQLYHSPWIDQIRDTTLGGLILGFQFVWVDFIRYSAGAMICVAIEKLTSNCGRR